MLVQATVCKTVQREFDSLRVLHVLRCPVLADSWVRDHALKWDAGDIVRTLPLAEQVSNRCSHSFDYTTIPGRLTRRSAFMYNTRRAVRYTDTQKLKNKEST